MGRDILENLLTIATVGGLGTQGERGLVNGAVELPPEVYRVGSQILSTVTGNPILQVAGNAMAGEAEGGIGEAVKQGGLTYGGQQLAKFGQPQVDPLTQSIKEAGSSTAPLTPMGEQAAAGFYDNLTGATPVTDTLGVVDNGLVAASGAAIPKGAAALGRNIFNNGVMSAAESAFAPDAPGAPGAPPASVGSTPGIGASPSAGPSGLNVTNSSAPDIYPWRTSGKRL